VVIGDLLAEAGQPGEAAINAAGGKALFITLDVTSEADWPPAIEAKGVAAARGMSWCTRRGWGVSVPPTAVQHARAGIRANAVPPGWIDTPMTERLRADPERREDVVRRPPLGRSGVPPGGR
jgi:Enoyl-(Acyl carrier protein) reductase